MAVIPNPDARERAAQVQPTRGDAPHRDRWAPRLLRHLRWVIAIKLLLIGLLFSLFFSSSHRPAIDAGGVSDRLQLSR